MRGDQPTAPVEEVVPTSSDRLSAAVLAHHTIVAAYLHNASDRLALFDTSGHARGEISLPGIGSLTSLDGRPDAPDVLLTFTSFTDPPSSYRCALPALTLAAFPRVEPPAPRAPSPAIRSRSDYETRQVRYASRDGTLVSMFLVHRRDLVRDGRRPVLLSGYGGFNISRTPAFDPGTCCRSSTGAECLRWPTCAAAASTARNGTAPACSNGSRTSSTISSPPREYLTAEGYTRAGRARDRGRQQRRAARRAP